MSNLYKLYFGKTGVIRRHKAIGTLRSQPVAEESIMALLTKRCFFFCKKVKRRHYMTFRRTLIGIVLCGLLFVQNGAVVSMVAGYEASSQALLTMA